MYKPNYDKQNYRSCRLKLSVKNFEQWYNLPINFFYQRFEANDKKQVFNILITYLIKQLLQRIRIGFSGFTLREPSFKSSIFGKTGQNFIK